MKILPPVIAFSLMITTGLLDWALSATRVVPLTMGAGAAAIFIAMGMFLLIWPISSFNKKETTHMPFGTPSALVVSGPYQYTRNPMYVALTLIQAGISLFIGRPVSLLAAPLFFVIMNFRQIPYEEKLLTELFGDEYLEFCKNVRRWI